MSPAQFAYLLSFLKERSGLALNDDKRYLVEMRLEPLARSLAIGSLAELVNRVSRNDDLRLQQLVIEAMTTNETFFFRDTEPFTAFGETILPELARRRPAGKPIRVWSAACSTGQEAYSLAMAALDNPTMLGGRRVEIVGTDLSQEVVDRARLGEYTQFEIQRGLPTRMMLKHFAQAGERWRASETLKQMVSFRTLNLLRDFSALGQFDVVFCRNVLIYFDEAAKTDLLRRIAKQTAADGYLALGSAEAAVGQGSPFQPLAGRRFIYTPKPAAAPAPRIALAGG